MTYWHCPHAIPAIKTLFVYTPNCLKWWSKCLYINLSQSSKLIFPQNGWCITVITEVPLANSWTQTISCVWLFSKSEWEVIRNSFAVGLFFPKSLLNPESALDFVAKLNYSIKARAHGLFLKKEYFCILNLKMGVSSWFWRRI